MDVAAVAEEILALEREALDKWSSGDPGGYGTHLADDASYFDDIGAAARLDGVEAIRAYLTSLEGQIPPHDYELDDPRVQLCGDVAVLTLRYFPSVEGRPGQPWKASTVYRRAEDGWEVVHAHWSTLEV